MFGIFGGDGDEESGVGKYFGGFDLFAGQDVNLQGSKVNSVEVSRCTGIYDYKIAITYTASRSRLPVVDQSFPRIAPFGKGSL